MRLLLAPLSGLRLPYTAVFVCYGRLIAVPKGRPRPRKGAALLSQVCREGVMVADHLWSDETAALLALGVAPQDALTFTAVACPYQRRQYLDRQDAEPDAYKLTSLLDIRIVQSAPDR